MEQINLKAQHNHANASRTSLMIRGSLFGIAGNLFLSSIKIISGLSTNSIAVLAEGIDNLSDCLGYILTWLGSTLAARQGDSMHPYGHGRMEYITGFLLSILILLSGFSLGKEAFEKLIHPCIPVSSPLLYIVCVLSIIIKLGLWYQSLRQNKHLHSAAVEANGKNSLSDVFVTCMTLLSCLVSPYTSLPVDAVAGFIISLIILYDGLTSFGKCLIQLLGEGPNKEMRDGINAIIEGETAFDKMEALTLHDYGPEAKIVFILVTAAKGVSQDELKTAVTKAIREIENTYPVTVSISLHINQLLVSGESFS